MWLTFLTVFAFLHTGNCQNVSALLDKVNPLLSVKDNFPTCIVDIIQRYFAAGKVLTYVNNMDRDADEVLIRIHGSQSMAVNIRTPPAKVSRRNEAYLIMVRNLQQFKKNIISLNKEATWNPYARFLVMFKAVEKQDLWQVFDIFLDLHVINVVVSTGLAAELHTYDPWQNFACGKYYNEIIEFGKCADVTGDIYPHKVKTGLQNCFFNVSVAHWPPYGIDPTRVTDGAVGMEQYIFDLISKIMHFKYNFTYYHAPESFSVVTENMTVTGPMLLLTQNHTDAMIGGFMLIPSRESMFFYVHGYFDNVDEVRLMVKKAIEIPAWRNFYLEFSPLVWVTLLLALVIYSALVIILIRARDKGHVVLILLDNMLSHGSKISSRQSVQCVFILFVWFTFLLNCFYTTTLMSLTTKPSLEYQISNEEDIRSHGLKPCISLVMNTFRKSESVNGEILQDIDIATEGCESFLDSVKSVSESNRFFTIILYAVYMYNRQQFYDEYGRTQLYSFPKPYAKVIYGMYFKKGFPMFEKLHSLALRFRESGLADKRARDMLYQQMRKYSFRSLGFVTRFTIPWHLYFVGVFISCITFGIELAAERRKIAPIGNELAPLGNEVGHQ